MQLHYALFASLCVCGVCVFVPYSKRFSNYQVAAPTAKVIFSLHIRKLAH